MSRMYEIRWHGRAGQGVVTAGELLGESAMAKGSYFQSFPEYGAERMGAPIKSYTRISDESIEIHSPILEPDMVIVVNPNLIGAVDLTEGLKENGALLMNTHQSPDTIRRRLDFQKGALWCVDASRIAMEELRRDIPSTMMIGLVIRAMDDESVALIDLETVVHTVRESLEGRLRPEVVEANVRAVRRVYDECVKG
jgi:pyruvate ferredoxin oxidoreductase gamma subunit